LIFLFPLSLYLSPVRRPFGGVILTKEKDKE